MKTKIFILFPFISYSLIACCFKTEDKDYIDYFHKINAAEVLISDSNYEKALSIYTELFHTYPSSFYKDLHNACLCALKLGNYDEALALASDLVNYGYELKDFESQAFDSFRNQKKQWNKFLSEYPRLRKQYEEKLNIPLRNQYLALYEIDQQAASHHTDIRMQDSVFYQLAIATSNLIKGQGFSHLLQKKDSINLKLYVMLRHYCGLKNRIMNNEELLQDSLYAQMDQNDIPLLVEQALHKGLITPDMYEGATTYWDNRNPYGRLAVMINFNTEEIYPFLQETEAKIPEINHLRNSIGLPPVAGELSDSLLFSTWYKYYPFQEIREAFLSCDTCDNDIDFMKIKNRIEIKRENEFSQKKDSSFILRDWDEIRDFHYMGIKPIMDSKLKKNGINTQ